MVTEEGVAERREKSSTRQFWLGVVRTIVEGLGAR